MPDRARTMNRVIEGVLGTGVTVSGLFLLAGLVLGENRLLAAGILLLMATPLLRVLVLTAALFVERDWLFAFVSLGVLTVLTTSVLWAIRTERAKAEPVVGSSGSLPLGRP